MIMPNDLSDVRGLFSWPRHSPKFKSLDDELDAIANGTKAISLFAFSPREVVDSTADLHAEVMRLALQRQLAVTHIGGTRGQGQIRVFVYARDHAWRIPALETLYRLCTDGEYGWSEGAEVLESTLLGYSESDIKGWLDTKRARYVNNHGETIYIILDASQRSELEELGFKAVSAGLVGDALSGFFTTGPGYVAPEAVRALAPGITIVRAAVTQSYLMSLSKESGSFDGDILKVSIRKEAIPSFNLALRSGFQVLSPDGWK